MNKLLTFGCAALALGTLALAACGGDDDDDSKSTPKSEATQQAPAGADSTRTTSGPTASNEPTKAAGDGQVTGSGADALRKLAKDLSTKTFQVSYEFTQTPAGKQPQKSTMTLAQKPPKSLTSGENLGAAGTSFIFINDGTNSYSCFKEGAAEGQCVKTKPDANPLGNIFSLDAILKSITEDINVTTAGSKTIAGIDSQCFNAKGATAGDQGTACFSKKDGIVTLLDTKSADGSAIHIEATKQATSVDDSVFTPPSNYKVTSVP